MTVLVFFGMVILFSLVLCAVDKIRAFIGKDAFSFSFDGDSVKVERNRTTDIKGVSSNEFDISYRRESRKAC